jgi:S-(hydroxymethyl)mycothiol dehydrogenase
VILNWRAVCGNCRAVPRASPKYCFSTFNATQKMTLLDGTELSPALGIGAFAEKTLVAAGQCTKVDPSAPATTAGLLGCGVMAGIGAAMNTGNVGRGDSVAVFGCGGVGDAAIAGARLAGATTIIAVDLDDRKLEWAKEFGATHTVQRGTTDPVEAIRASPAATAPTCASRPSATRRLQAGVRGPRPGRHRGARRRAAPDMTLELPFIEVFGRGRPLKSVVVRRLPAVERDFPMLIDLYLQGRLDLDRFVSETISLDDVEEAFHKMERGEVLRSVVSRVLMSIELVTTDGIFALDGGSGRSPTTSGSSATTARWWCSTPRTTRPIVERDQRPPGAAIVLTHGHNDHINAAVRLRDAVDAPIAAAPRRPRCCGTSCTPTAAPIAIVRRGGVLGGPATSWACCTRPATRPGAAASTTCAGVVFSGDTLFCGGPGATGRSFSDEPTILRLDPRSLLALPDHTIVHTGHGDSTTIGAERQHVLQPLDPRHRRPRHVDRLLGGADVGHVGEDRPRRSGPRGPRRGGCQESHDHAGEGGVQPRLVDEPPQHRAEHDEHGRERGRPTAGDQRRRRRRRRPRPASPRRARRSRRRRSRRSRRDRRRSPARARTPCRPMGRGTRAGRARRRRARCRSPSARPIRSRRRFRR